MYDILGIGNAIVDVIAPVGHDFLSRHDLHPGSMTLVDEARAAALEAAMPPGKTVSGGSAANTCAMAARLGARVGFLGKVAEDGLGRAFRAGMAEAGVDFPSAPLAEGAPTGRCLVLVTEGGQRTMATLLGASVAFGEHDVDAARVASAQVVYLEGYLFDPPAAQRAFRQAAAAARQAGRRVALSLSDAFCVDRHRRAFAELLPEVDLLFANEAEAASLFETNDLGSAVEALAGCVTLAVVTRSEAGSLIVAGGERIAVPAAPATVVDTTGAGDAYAAGFLAGWVRGEGLARCGAMGAEAAAEVIGRFGAR
jgi:sugar/nucleoside kinase (ribokinase family)